MRMTKEKEREKEDANMSDLSDILAAKCFDHVGPVVRPHRAGNTRRV